MFCGFNPKRVFNGYLFAGAGLNRGCDNDEANALDTRTHELEYLWQDGKFLVAGRFGLGCDLRLNDRLSINIEANANALSDFTQLYTFPLFYSFIVKRTNTILSND